MVSKPANEVETNEGWTTAARLLTFIHPNSCGSRGQQPMVLGVGWHRRCNCCQTCQSGYWITAYWRACFRQGLFQSDIEAGRMPYDNKEQAGGNDEGRRPGTRHNLCGNHMQPNLNLNPHCIGMKKSLRHGLLET